MLFRSGALQGELDRGPARILRGITVEGRQPPRAGFAVRVDGRVVGEVTSGNFSPILGHGVALAFVEPEVHLGDAVVLEARGRELQGTVVRPPFVRRV